MIDIRTKLQDEFSDKAIEKCCRGYFNISVRFGKCILGLNIVNKLKAKKVLIAYPDNKIKNSWLGDIMKCYTEFGIDVRHVDFVFSSYLSLAKNMDEYDLVFLDEVHTLSDAQKEVVSGDLCILNSRIIALSGTVSKDTHDFLQTLEIPLLGTYTESQSISNDIVADYSIKVHIVPLDDKKKIYKNNTKTEKKQFGAYSWVIDKKREDGASFNSLKMLYLSRTRIIYNSIAKQNKLKELLKQYKDEKILIYVKSIEVAESLGIASYHSKSKGDDANNLQDFINGKIKHLAVVNIAKSGVTFPGLERIIIMSLTSNGEEAAQQIGRAMLLDYKGKKANIDIISTNEPTESKWVSKGLEFKDKNKIKYIL